MLSKTLSLIGLIQTSFSINIKWSTYTWSKCYDEYNIRDIYFGLNNDKLFDYDELYISVGTNMEKKRALVDKLKYNKSKIKVYFDISNNKILDDFCRLQDQKDILRKYFGKQNITHISIDIEPHVYFNDKADWKDRSNRDYYLNIWLDLLKYIREKLPGIPLKVAIPLFYPEHILRELRNILNEPGDGVLVMCYEFKRNSNGTLVNGTGLNNGRMKQINRIYDIFYDCENRLLLRIKDFNTYEELYQTAVKNYLPITNNNQIGLSTLRDRIEVLKKKSN